MNPDSQAQTTILEFWRLVELFTPQTVPETTGAQSTDGRVIEWNPKQALPWRALPPTGSDRVWQHTVYLGLYELSAVYETLHKAFADDRDAEARRPRGRTASVGLLVDESGCLVPGSAILSSCAWAVGRICRSPRRHDLWLGEFEQARNSFGVAIQTAEDRRSKLAGTTSPVALGTRSLEELRRLAANLTGLERVPELRSSTVLIHSRQVSPEEARGAADTDVVNSSQLDDLGKIGQAVEEGNAGEGLRRYLTPQDRAQREDDRQRSDAATTGASAARIPWGRWPRDPEDRLTISQQVAVNGAAQGANEDGGVPGIGGFQGNDTAAPLRDLIAHNIVQRAGKLAALSTTGDAFDTAPGSEWEWTTDGYPRRLPRVRPETTGFEMVVASAGSADSEKQTDEISAAEAIAEPWRGHVEHFTKLASRIRRDRTGDQPEQAWALICASLGAETERSEFMDSFWWGSREAGQDADTAGLEQLLKAPNAQPRQWKASVAEFQSSLDEVRRLQAERVEAERRWLVRPELTATLAEVRQRVEELARSRRRLEEQLAAHDQSAADIDERLAHLRQTVDQQQAAKPGLWETVTSFGRARREWRSALEASETALRQGQQRADEASEAGAKLRSAASKAAAQERMLQADESRLSTRLSTLNEEISADQAAHGDCHPGSPINQARDTPTAPWQDREFNTARTELFLAALGLHRAFIHDQAIQIRRGLNAARDVILGECPDELDEPARLAAWRLFFLVVPVISAPLDALPRMFRGLGAEAFGWLFIDGAEQCAPQDAVGGIWRARHTIALGDPLQGKPAVAIPSRVIGDMATSLKVGAAWLPSEASVATLADGKLRPTS